MINRASGTAEDSLAGLWWDFGEKYLKILGNEINLDIQIGKLTRHCLHTPGHTPGGIIPYVDLNQDFSLQSQYKLALRIGVKAQPPKPLRGAPTFFLAARVH
ncbi:hypothetical protein JT05_09330 [Desulfosporosinus sp. Tol-M]|nr:hypothetical protein JT05_09330 [Desulfosporosinus sp. Tol-M]